MTDFKQFAWEAKASRYGDTWGSVTDRKQSVMFYNLSVIPPAQDIFLFSKDENVETFLTKSGFSSIEFKEINTTWKASSGYLVPMPSLLVSIRSN